jgi:hypothetical protein
MVFQEGVHAGKGTGHFLRLCHARLYFAGKFHRFFSLYRRVVYFSVFHGLETFESFAASVTWAWSV